MKKLKMMGIMLFVSTVLVGCGTTAETKIDEKATEKTSVSKKVLNLMENSEIGSMDSIFTQDEASINAQSNVFEGLYQLDEKDQLIPAAAKEMPEISEDGKRYTIKLREDGKWSNGDAVTANDFVFAWRKLANPKNQANYFFLLEGTILNGTAITKEEKAPEELGVKALDDYTLEVTLEKPVPYFTSLLAFSPFFPQNVYNLYESGELDVAVLTGDFAKQNRDNPDYEAIERSKVYSLRLNQKRNEKPSIFANENVRKALAYALDKKSLVDNILADGSKEIYGYIPEKFVYNPETNEDFRHEAGALVKTDAKKAKEYLDKAKAELNGDVAIELLSRDGDSDRKVAEFIQGQLQETLPGLTINVKTVPLNNAIELMRKGDYELSVGMWGPDYQDPMTFLESSVSGNRMNYSSPTFDQLIEEATTKYANDPETRWQTLIKAEKVLVEEDAALIPLYQEARSQLVRPGVKGIQYHNFGATSTYKYAYKE